MLFFETIYSDEIPELITDRPDQTESSVIVSPKCVQIESGVMHSGMPANLIDGGFTYKVCSNFQLDIAGGVGLSEEAEDWFLGAGFSYRIPR